MKLAAASAFCCQVSFQEHMSFRLASRWARLLALGMTGTPRWMFHFSSTCGRGGGGVLFGSD